MECQYAAGADRGLGFRRLLIREDRLVEVRDKFGIQIENVLYLSRDPGTVFRPVRDDLFRSNKPTECLDRTSGVRVKNIHEVRDDPAHHPSVTRLLLEEPI